MSLTLHVPIQPSVQQASPLVTECKADHPYKPHAGGSGGRKSPAACQHKGRHIREMAILLQQQRHQHSRTKACRQLEHHMVQSVPGLAQSHAAAHMLDITALHI